MDLKTYATEQIRNLALAGHTAAGKTSLVEALAYRLKQSDRLGKTEDGNTISDYDPEEIKRKCSIQASLIQLEHGDYKVNLVDLPGFRDFVSEIRGGIRACESMLLVFDATGGVSAGAETAWAYAGSIGRPRAVFINKLDKEHTSFAKSMETVSEGLGARLIPLVLPVGEGTDFKGVIDLISMKMIVEDGQKVSTADIPAELADAAQEAHAALVEAAAEGDEELMERFFGDEELSAQDILKGLSEVFLEGSIVPCFGGSATQLKGLRPLRDFFELCAPHPGQFSTFEAAPTEDGEPQPLQISGEGPTALYVWKTVSDPFVGHLNYYKVVRGKVSGDQTLLNQRTAKNERLGHIYALKGKQTEEIQELAAGDMGAVAKLASTATGDVLRDPAGSELFIPPTRIPKPTVFAAIKAASRSDEDKLGDGLHRLQEQDPSLKLVRDSALHQTVMAANGETQLNVAIARLEAMSKVKVSSGVPRVAYRETITKTGQGQGKYKKQTGGSGQYGDCWIRFDPQPEGSGFEFVWEIVGGVIPTNFQSAIEKGLIEAMEKGVLAGSQTVDVKAACYDGSYHSVDSSDMAFKVAASLAFKNIIPQCGPVILEPIYKAVITVPEEYMGDVMGDLNGRRGRILGMEQIDGKQVIQALVPLAELYTYARQLNSLTQGRGEFEMEYDHYERVPNDVQDKIIAEAAARKEAEEG